MSTLSAGSRERQVFVASIKGIARRSIMADTMQYEPLEAQEERSSRGVK